MALEFGSKSLIGLDLKKNMHWQTDQKSQLVKKDKDQIREQRETRTKKRDRIS